MFITKVIFVKSKNVVIEKDERIYAVLENDCIDDNILSWVYENTKSEYLILINPNEYMDPRFIDIQQFTNLNKKFAEIKIIYTKDFQNYFIKPDNSNGIYNQVRIFNLKLCTKDEILNQKYCLDEIQKINILIINDFTNTEPSTVSLFDRTLSIQEIFTVADRFENVGEIDSTILPDLIKKKLEKISDYFLNDFKGLNHIGLYTADSGVALLLSVYYLHTYDKKYLDAVNRIMDSLNEYLESQNNYISSFCSGLAGLRLAGGFPQ